MKPEYILFLSILCLVNCHTANTQYITKNFHVFPGSSASGYFQHQLMPVHNGENFLQMGFELTMFSVGIRYTAMLVQSTYVFHTTHIIYWSEDRSFINKNWHPIGLVVFFTFDKCHVLLTTFIPAELLIAGKGPGLENPATYQAFKNAFSFRKSLFFSFVYLI